MTNHIDQLAQWWHDAEEGIGKAGDVVIERDDSPNFETASYVVFTLGRDEHENLTYRRILARAPEPKPAWHDAAAVMASTVDAADGSRWAFAAGPGDLWYDADGGYRADELIDPAPLIEAKVTDEMVLRALNASAGLDLSHLTAFKRNEVEDMRFALTAALGIEEEK